MKVAVLTLLISCASLAAAEPQFGLGGLLSGLVGGNRFGGGGRGPTQNLGPGAFGQQNNQQVDFNSRVLLSTLDPHIFLRTRKPVRLLQL